MDCIVCGVEKSQRQLSNFCFHQTSQTDFTVKKVSHPELEKNEMQSPIPEACVVAHAVPITQEPSYRHSM